MAKQRLKIATWNVDRPNLSTVAKNASIIRTLEETDADVLVLTETNSCIDLGAGYTGHQTPDLFRSLSIGGEEYKQGENRVTIWSRLQAVRRIDMCNSHSALCVRITTDWGDLNIYGTVIGIYGKNRLKAERLLTQTDFERTLEVQLADWERLAQTGKLCVAGDFNLSLDSSYYVTKRQRQRILECFRKLDITVTTEKLSNNLDHIAISDSFLDNFELQTGTWPRDKTDHQGVWLKLEDTL